MATLLPQHTRSGILTKTPIVYLTFYLCISLCPAVVFVVDSEDCSRLPEVGEELTKLVGETQLKETLILILANKQVRSDIWVVNGWVLK